MKKIALVAVAMAMGSSLSLHGAQKRYLGAGWDFGALPLVDIVQSLDELAKTPLDGIRFSFKAEMADGTKVSSRTAMDGKRWPVDIFDPQFGHVRKLTALPNMKHCFIGVRAAPNKRLAWTDDEAWASFAHNMGVLARAAKLTGVKGLCPDYEDYVHQYQYSLADSDPELDTTLALARKRGAEVHKAIFDAYPDITLFFWHFLDRHFPHHFSGYVDIQQRYRRDLFIAFLNGVFDALPPTARIVACEEDYKYSAARRDFYKAIAEEKQFNEQLLDPVHRTKHRLQVSLGFAIYLDAYRPDNQKSQWALGPDKYGSFAGHIIEDAEQATRASDEYVWFWGEKRTYVPWRKPGVASGVFSCRQFAGDKRKTWNQEFEGLYDALFRFKDPKGFAKKVWGEIASGAMEAKLVVNEECKSLDGFMQWQKKRKTPGTFAVDNTVGCGDSTSVVLNGVHGALTSYARNRKARGKYLVRCVSKGEGDAGTSVVVSWLKDGNWNFKIPSAQIPAVGEYNGWTERMAVIEIPEGQDGFGVKLSGSLRGGQKAWFDDLTIHALPPFVD